MYDPGNTLHLVGRQRELPVSADPHSSFRLALTRVRKLLREFVPGMLADPGSLLLTLQASHAPAALEAERLFSLGWMSWWLGEFPQAENYFTQAEESCRQAPKDPVASSDNFPVSDPARLSADVAYWNSRIRLLLGYSTAVADFERALRGLGGQPLTTCYYVDLLWRSGRFDRAEQVWKTVRSNKRVQACEEAVLIDARVGLRRGDLGPAERLLREAVLRNAVNRVEQHLLLAWTLVGLRQLSKSTQALEVALGGPYPPTALQTWQRQIDSHRRGASPVEPTDTLGWREFFAGQQFRRSGELLSSREQYRLASAVPAVAAFARYGLMVLGQEDPAAVLAMLPGAYFGLRARTRQSLERFRRRELSPTEFLESTAPAHNAGYQEAALQEFHRLAALLQQLRPSADELRRFVEVAPDGVARGNAVRLALEQGVKHLDNGDLHDLLMWFQTLPGLSEELLHDIFEQRIRLALRARSLDILPPSLPSRAAVHRLAESLLGGSPLSGEQDQPLTQLARIAEDLSTGAGTESHQELLKKLATTPTMRGLTLSLRVVEAATRKDLTTLVSLFEDVEGWASFRAGPPRFVVRILESAVQSSSGFSGWPKLAPWLTFFRVEDLGDVAGTLYQAAGLPMGALTANVPPDVDPTAWWLHQAARAVLREDPQGALNAFKDLPQPLEDGTIQTLVEKVLPELQRQADAVALARCFPETGEKLSCLNDLVDLLRGLNSGGSIIEQAHAGETSSVRMQLANLAKDATTPAPIYHHLCLLSRSAALHLEVKHSSAAVEHWQQTWRHAFCWLSRDLAVSARGRELLFDHFLTCHRQTLNALLAREETDTARAYWNLIVNLPNLASEYDEPLSRELTRRVGELREALATEYLQSTREVMEHGEVPIGHRANYEQGVDLLIRLIDLDRENIRLLTALCEICNDWFLDLYHLQIFDRIDRELDRIDPYVECLLRLFEDRSGDLAARSALSDIFKVRGFLARDPGSQVELYREALRLHPGNSNVRDLLKELGAEDVNEESESDS